MKIALVGKAASGKDFLRKRLMDTGFRYGVSHTTRQPREGEVDGKDYHFVTTDEFISLIDEGKMIEYQEFNGWYYGMTIDTWRNADVVILNAEAVDLLDKDLRKECTVIYLDIPRSVREQRMLQRNDHQDSTERRLRTDDEQFAGFVNYDIKITNPDF